MRILSPKLYKEICNSSKRKFQGIRWSRALVRINPRVEQGSLPVTNSLHVLGSKYIFHGTRKSRLSRKCFRDCHEYTRVRRRWQPAPLICQRIIWNPRMAPPLLPSRRKSHFKSFFPLYHDSQFPLLVRGRESIWIKEIFRRDPHRSYLFPRRNRTRNRARRLETESRKQTDDFIEFLLSSIISDHIFDDCSLWM